MTIPANLISRKIDDNNIDRKPNVDTDKNNGGIFYPFPLNENGANSGLGNGGVFATLTGSPNISRANFALIN